ncbi:hypothetical protein LTR50_005517 [Elasticomyces elasticus]|nr:hypothetical protein LTR50_005517 [Elasticomyces elasticus]
MPTPFARVRAAAIDSRLANVLKRQEELERLHQTLVRNGSAITDAIIHDSGHTPAEAAVEYHLALSTVKEQYASLRPAQQLEDEYRIARGADAPDRREAGGIVYIVPTQHTIFFSVVAPLSAALAAGNCVVIQLENNLRTLLGLLRGLLRSALDNDIIDFYTSRPDDADFLARCTEVLQTGAEQPPKANTIVSPAQERVIAVVDQTANLQEAARALVTARFSFGGKSPYAPDLLLVSEFAKKNLLDAVVQESIGFLTAQNGVVIGETRTVAARADGTRDLLDEVQKEGSARIVTTGSNGTILDVQKRDSAAFRRKITECCLCVHAVSSLDDAIDLANSYDTLLATYVFANLPSAKYLAQFINARVAFVNHVPTELLVGPASPLNEAVNPSLRYPTTLFSVPRPQYATAPQRSALLAEVLRSGSAKEIQRLPAALKAEELGAVKRPMGGGIGYFEQGILTGLGMVLTPTLAAMGVLGWYAVKTMKAR